MSKPKSRLTSFIRDLNNPEALYCSWTVAALLLLGESLLTVAIIFKVPYTEIDWVAYMEQVEIFQSGERDYLRIKGQTGPLVYPAGFVYFYSALHWLTGGGDIFRAQLVFAVLYIATQALMLYQYVRSKLVPPWALCLLCLSKRLHSIYVLRLFNDCVAMFLAYLATLFLQQAKWKLAIFTYSAAVSVKMNVLLMAPPVLVVLLQGACISDILKGVAAGIGLQLLLGSPFLLHHPFPYFSRAFEFSRVFFHKWTVNLKFLPNGIFQSKELAVALLLLHLAFLTLFATCKWFPQTGGLPQTLRTLWDRARKTNGSSASKRPILSPAYVLSVVFVGNFIGIVFARTLHYQFYSWYFHTIPFLLWQARVPVLVKLAVWFIIEVVWNIYPSSAWSSITLCACHVFLLFALLLSPVPGVHRGSSKQHQL